MKNAKLYATIALAILVLIVIVQNFGKVSVKLLFVTLEMPHILLLLLTVSIGFVIGVMYSSLRRK